jgi:hypothetical protein
MAFYPIAKNERDLRLLAALLQEGITQPADLGRLFQADLPETAEPPLRLRWRLAKNKMALAGYGAQTIPFILSTTVIEGPRLPWTDLFSRPEPAQPAESSGCGLVNQEELPCE